MPGRLRASFRSGNLAEDLGFLLLKGIAAVAEVSRPEDVGVGIDAVATLLRRDDDGNCYAEDSFCVQLKSDSTESLSFEGHELRWLINQTQPMFIGLVSLANSRISLYPTLFVSHAVLAYHAEDVTLRFGRPDVTVAFTGYEWVPWRGESGSRASVWLGEPLAQGTLQDLTDPDWVRQTYLTLKRFLSVARREIELLSLGQCSAISWSTNDMGSIAARPAMMKGKPDGFDDVANRCAPYLRALAISACTVSHYADRQVLRSLFALAESLRVFGSEIDPENLFGRFLGGMLPIGSERDR